MTNINELSTSELHDRIMAVTTELIEREKAKKFQGDMDAIAGVTEETIEHEGLLLQKVGRNVSAGDYVRFNDMNYASLENGLIYCPVKRSMTVGDNNYNVFNEFHNRTPENVEVFEIVGAVPKVIKSPNQQRSELIQRGKYLMDNSKKYREGEMVYITKGRPGYWCDAEFIVNQEKRTVVCLLRHTHSNRVVERGIAKCMPGDVFNEWIGKLIALYKALEIEIPKEFLDAVQPTEIEIGMKIISSNGTSGGVSNRSSEENYSLKYAREINAEGNITIIDDTNAEYDHGQR